MTGVRLGIVGLGQMGRVHARNLTDLGGQIVAGSDVAPEAREAFEREFDVPTFDDHDAMLDGAPVDATVITTPNRYHESAAVAALEAGCDVLVEKPLAHSVDSAERIAGAADRAPGFCMVGFHSRFSPAASTARAYRDAGELGEITHVEATFLRRRGIPSPGSWFTASELSGGGALIDIGVHVLDLALDVLDFPSVVEVSGVARSTFGPRNDYADPDGFSSTWTMESDRFDVDDSVSAFIRCATGQTISLEVAWATNREPEEAIVARGTEAGARFDLEGDVVTLYGASDLGVDHYRTTEIDARGGPDAHIVEAKQFLESAAAGVPPSMNTVGQGVTVQRVIDAIYRSNDSGRACAVEPPVQGHAD